MNDELCVVLSLVMFDQVHGRETDEEKERESIEEDTCERARHGRSRARICTDIR